MTIELLLNIIALALVALSCFLHLNANVDPGSPECEAWGFILTGGGAFGVAVSLIWPRLEIQMISYETVMHVGMALIALWLVGGRLRSWVSTIPGLHWADRRRS